MPVEKGATLTNSVVVSVGYGWQKYDIAGKKLERNSVDNDIFWKSLKFTKEDESVKASNGELYNVEVKRLRSTHGCLVWDSIIDHIEKSDVLMFDVVDQPDWADEEIKKAVDSLCDGDDCSKIFNSFNSNVLIEIGVALALRKELLLLCPEHLFDKLPSDVKGYCWSTYKFVWKDDEIKREFIDARGFYPAYQSKIKRAAEAKAAASQN